MKTDMGKAHWSKSLLLIVFFFNAGVGLRPALAQDTTNTISRVSISSPTAASLGKYGDIPVNYHTGIPNINIPVYTIKSGSLALPIGLSYHGSGLKVQEQASWVGAGWSLNAGGVITRSVMGAPDDRGFSYNQVTNGHYSDYGYNSYIFSPSAPDDISFARGQKDGEPDLYFYNFGGYSGKFYFNDDRTPIFIPEQDFRVQPYLETGYGFVGFIVTTPDGIRYYFGKPGNNSSVNPIESTIPSTLQNGPSNAIAAASSWYLNKIISGDGVDSITFIYQPESYSYYSLALTPVLSTNYYPNDASMNGINLVKDFVNGVRLSQVIFANGSVIFSPSAAPRTDLTAGSATNAGLADVANTSAYSLGSITISDSKGFCKKDSLYYGYFYDNSPLTLSSAVFGPYNIHSDAYRLRLDSMKEFSCDGTIAVPAHTFTYFSEPVPRQLSFGLDHWGYYNGVTSNQVLVPTYTVTTSGTTTTYSGANRDAAWPAMRGGALSKITYPTGGYTLFDFEPNDTYSSHNEVRTISDLYMPLGFDGGVSPQTGALVANRPSYNVTTSNTTPYDARLEIRDGSNNLIQSSYILANSSQTSTASPAAGTYQFTISWVSPPTLPGGTGVQLSYSHQETVLVTQNVIVGGLRIKTITHNDGNAADNMVTSYSYRSGSQSTGILYSRPTYVQVIRNDNMALVWPYCSPGGCSSCDGVNSHAYYVSPSSIRPMATTQGNIIGYNEVDVSQPNNGYSVYRYYGSNIWAGNIADVCTRTLNQSSTCDQSIPNFPAAPLPFEFKRGELSYEGHFDQSGNLLKESYHYPVYATDPLTTPGHISVDLPGMFSYTEYNLQSAAKTVDSTTTRVYNKVTGSYLTTRSIRYFGSAFHHMPTRNLFLNSTGDSLITNIKYAFDFRIPGCDAIPDSLPYYLNTVNSDYNWMLSNIATCTPQINNSNNCRSSIFTQYRQMLGQARINFINYRRRSFSDSSNQLSYCYITAAGSADNLLKPVLRLQQAYVNVPIETSNWKNQNLLHASFTSYDTSVSPLGFIYPNKAQLINLSAPSLSFTNAAVSTNTLTKDSRYQDEATYTFGNGNPQVVTGRDGLPNSFIWDYQQKEPVCKVSNASIGLVAYTSFEADGTGNWSIGSALRDNTGGITGSQAYNLANGAISRNGLDVGKTYVVSYWSKNGSYNVNGVAATSGRTVNGWSYYEHQVASPAGGSVTVTGSGLIDELRLYPVNAQMTTYTYSPLLGMTSQCDVNNRVTYYEYDALGRLKDIKDQDGNIIKTIDYHYQNQ
jgi:YD repeat-containing protein